MPLRGAMVVPQRQAVRLLRGEQPAWDEHEVPQQPHQFRGAVFGKGEVAVGDRDEPFARHNCP